jgi:hypothetical protein
MRIDSSGNVGIGTSSPTRKLDVNDSSSANTIPLAVSNLIGGLDIASAGIDFNAHNVNFARIVGGQQTNGTFADGNLIFLTRNAETVAERMRITSAGNVGIGTSSPAQKLDVTGAILASQSVTIGTSGLYQAGSIYSDSNFGMIFRAKQASPAVEQFRWASSTDSRLMCIDTSGALILDNSTAQKTTGTTWSNPSDVRLKDNIQDYTKGLSELMQVNVKTWEYNGKGGTIQGTKGLGVIADEIKEVLPDTVDDYKAKLNADDEKVTAIKKFDATEITWLMLKSIQEQQAIITDLKSRIEVLENK